MAVVAQQKEDEKLLKLLRDKAKNPNVVVDPLDITLEHERRSRNELQIAMNQARAKVGNANVIYGQNVQGMRSKNPHRN